MPASLSGTIASVIAVGASNNRDVRSAYSQFGPQIDFVAPSNDTIPGPLGIWTTDRLGAPGYNGLANQDYTNQFGGTSSATPLAAGVGALLLGLEPTLTVAQLRALMRSTADRIGPLAYDANGFNEQYGYGRINANRAVRALNRATVAVSLGNANVASGTPVIRTGLAGQAQTLTFSVRSVGQLDLNLSGLQVTGPASFTLSQPLGATTLPLGQSTTFEVSFTSLTAGTFNATASFATNDVDLPTFTIPIQFTVGPVSIGGKVFEDRNGDGVIQPGESARAGETVYLDTDNSGTYRPPTATTFGSAANLGLVISNAAPIATTLSLSGLGPEVQGLEVRVRLTHTWVSDIRMVLEAPNGTSIELVNGAGGSGDNMTDTVFADDAALAISAGAAPFTGRFRPNQPLSTFSGGNSNGTWTLRIFDSVSFDNGTLVNWSLTPRHSGEPFRTSDALGDYRFLTLAPGSYRVRSTPSSGWSQVSPAGAHLVTVTGSESNLGRHFGHARQNSVYGNVYNDVDGNGAFNAGTDTVRAGATVILDTNGTPLPLTLTSSPALRIPDNATVTDTVVSVTTGQIASLTVALNITHTWVSDLEVRLTSPAGTVIPLVLRRGGNGDNFIGTVFDDAAASSISAGTAPFTGSFRPEQPLAALIGQTAGGNWQLSIVDRETGDSGTLVNWSLNLMLGGEISQTSDSLGNFRFDGVSGSNTLRAGVPSGLRVSEPPAGNYPLSLAAGQFLQNRNFGLAPAAADLSVTKTNGTTSSTPGGSTTYTITASNAGPGAAIGATVTDTFPAACTNVSWTCVGAGGGTCTAAGSGNINDTVNLPVGGSTTYTASCAISAAATGALSNTATVTVPGGVTDPVAGNNNATDTDTLSPQANLSITKTDGQTSVNAGTSTVYTITASNAGPSNAPAATVADVFPAACVSPTWTCTGAGGGSCTASGSGNISQSVNLPAGGSVSFLATCPVDLAATGTLSNTATVAVPGGVIDPVPANNSATDTAPIVAAPAPVLSINSVGLTEGDSGSQLLTFTVTSSNTTTAFTVDYATADGSASAGSDYTTTTGTLSFAAGGLPTRTIQVPILGDRVAEGIETFAVTLSNATGTAQIGSATGTGTITDNDVAGVTVTQSGGSTSVAEGGATDTYTLVLTSQPVANVTVTITPNAQLTTSPTSMVFTAANWATPQTVTVSAVNDAVAEGAHSGSITHAVTSMDPLFNGLSVGSVTATITDNDAAGVVITENSGTPNNNDITVTEGGAGSSVAVVLTSQPLSDVQISLTFNSTIIRAGAPTPGGEPFVLNFTSANWNLPQTVNVSAINDNVVRNIGSTNLSLTVGSADPNYVAIPTQPVSPIVVRIVEDDVAGVVITESSGTPNDNDITVTEGGAGSSVTVVLTSQPISDVQVSMTFNPTIIQAGSPTPGNDPVALVFTSANWNLPQVVNVRAVNDNVAQNIGSTTLSLVVGSADPNYLAIPTRPASPIVVRIVEDDSPDVTVAQSGGSTAVTEGGATDTHTLVLTSQPTANVVVALNSGAQLTATPSPLTFTSGNWNQPQTVTVGAVNDAIAEGTHSGSVTHTVTSADANYQGRLVDSVSVTITDNDAAGVQVTESGGSTAVTEGGAADTVSVVLASQPVADVTVTITPNAQLTATPSPLTFTSANWNQPQTVTVTASNDVVVEGTHSGTLGFGVASTDPAYGAITLPGITASITDNDMAVMSFAPASVSQSEATTPMVYTVTLSNPVASGVIAKVNSTNGTATAGADYTAIVDQTVTFAPGSTTAQTVSVAVTNDALDEDNETYTLTLSGINATGDVTLGAATATGTIEDDDALPVLSVANVTQAEGNAVNTLNFTVTLSPVSGRAVSFTRATVDNSAISTGLAADFVAIAASTVTIPAGQTSVTIPVTINGDAVFEGDEQFTLSLTGVANATPGSLSATATLTEDDQQPTTTMITADLPDPSVVGQPYPVTVEVRAQTLSPLGAVTVTDGTGASCNAPLVAGTAPVSTMTCTLTSTSAGAKTLTASYTPASEAFAASNDTESHTVNAAATSLVLLGPARARIGTAASYTAELSVTAPGAGTPAGVVTVSSGAQSCTITLPTATPSCTITFSTLGSRAVSASFAPGNGNFLGATATPVQTLVFSSSDLSVSKTNAVSTYRPGDLLVYTVVVRNTGPDPAPQVRIRDVAPAGLTNVAWTCEANGGAICPDAGGTGSLDHVVATLPTGGALTYAYFGNVSGRPLTIVNVAEVSLPADTTIEDPNLANNSATDTDLLDDLFADGFEAPGINAESGGVRLAGASLRSTLDEVARVAVRLSDVRGEALRVYARVVGGELQVALAVRGADGTLRLGAWQGASGEPELTWTATPAAGGFVLSAATLR